MMFIVTQATNSDVTNTASTTPVVATSTLAINSPVEMAVRHYFKDQPILIEIAKCESTFAQYEKDGSVRRGRVNSADIGVMQINEFYHAEMAKKKGYDIYTLEGNMAYARDLYNREGAQPWSSSSPCWGDKAQIASK
jgi:DNA-dependent RNA polymerase auxiliary subunit epsilon